MAKKTEIADWKQELRESGRADTVSKLREQYGRLSEELAAIPDGMRMPYQVLLGVRQVHAIKRMKEISEVPIQAILRRGVDIAIKEFFAGESPVTSEAKPTKRSKTA